MSSSSRFFFTVVVAATAFAVMAPTALAQCGKTIFSQNFDKYRGSFKCVSFFHLAHSMKGTELGSRFCFTRL